MYIIVYKNQRFILYLAVKEEYRNRGFGSCLLKWYLNHSEDKNIFLNIDEVNDQFDDISIRKKRLYFYLKNGFNDTNYLSVNKHSKYNILSTKKEFNVDEYKLLDKKISKWFFCKSERIEQKRFFKGE